MHGRRSVARRDRGRLPRPRKEDKTDARKAYAAARKRSAAAEQLLAAMKRYRPTCERRYIKLPATWLNKGSRQNDDFEPKPGSSRIDGGRTHTKMTTRNGCGLLCFGEKANSLQVSKGDRIYVEGRLKLETWTSQDGQARSGFKVAAWKCERLGNVGQNKSAKSKPVDAAPAHANGGDRRDSSRDWQRPGAMDDEIPFTPETRG